VKIGRFSTKLRNSAEGSQSNALWAAFDNTESRLGGRERHVVGHYRLGDRAVAGEALPAADRGRSSAPNCRR
jgi:hypothetical protein